MDMVICCLEKIVRDLSKEGEKGNHCIINCLEVIALNLGKMG